MQLNELAAIAESCAIVNPRCQFRYSLAAASNRNILKAIEIRVVRLPAVQLLCRESPVFRPRGLALRRNNCA